MTHNREFWRGRRTLITGHTGFKGAWLAMYLAKLGARVSGLALAPRDTPALYTLLQPGPEFDSHIADIRNPSEVRAVVDGVRPEIVIHMAAQALVRRSYREPVETMATNVMGTANLLNALRDSPGLINVLVVTSDKVYGNDGSGAAFTEEHPLGGDDPYSASKAAAEIVTKSWSRSYFEPAGIPLATARAGNVLGGGDFAEDRIVPDAWRAARDGVDLVLRYPEATRPWQHVLDLCAGYAMYVEALSQAGGEPVPPSLNFGPAPDQNLTVGEVAEAILGAMDARTGITIERASETEKIALSIDPGLAHRSIGWISRMTMPDTLAWTAEWYRGFNAGDDAKDLVIKQIDRYLAA